MTSHSDATTIFGTMCTPIVLYMVTMARNPSITLTCLLCVSFSMTIQSALVPSPNARVSPVPLALSAQKCSHTQALTATHVPHPLSLIQILKHIIVLTTTHVVTRVNFANLVGSMRHM